MRLIENGVAGSRQCRCCGSESMAGMIDTYAEDADGRVYLCPSCVRAAVDAIGGVATREEVDRLERDVNERTRERDAARVANAEARERLADVEPQLERALGRVAILTSERSAIESALEEQAEKLRRWERGEGATPAALARAAFAAAGTSAPRKGRATRAGS